MSMLKGLIFAQQVLLPLAEAGLRREDAYAIVQTHAMRAWEEKKNFRALIVNDKKILDHMSRKKIEEIFDVNYHLKYISAIFNRVFGKKEG